MDVAKAVAMHVENLRKEEQAHENAKQLFQKEINRIILNLEMKLSTFYERVEGYANPGDFLKRNHADNSYVFGDTEISLIFKKPEESQDFLTAVLDVKSRRAYVFQVAYNGKNFYWEYNNGELTDAKLDEIMHEIIFEN